MDIKLTLNPVVPYAWAGFGLTGTRAKEIHTLLREEKKRLVGEGSANTMSVMTAVCKKLNTFEECMYLSYVMGNSDGERTRVKAQSMQN